LLSLAIWVRAFFLGLGWELPDWILSRGRSVRLLVMRRLVRRLLRRLLRGALGCWRSRLWLLLLWCRWIVVFRARSWVWSTFRVWNLSRGSWDMVLRF
jgi:hypothetical protein